MAGQYDIFFSGETQAARDLVVHVIGEQGFAVEANPNGGLSARRGSTGATLLLGGLAGKNLQMTFFVEFLDGANGTLDARISRNTAASAIKGGALGASRTNNAFVDLVNAIAAAAQASGTFVSSASA